MKLDISLTEKSIQDAIDKLERYKDRLQDKCIAFVGELASNGITVAQANTGNFGHYITFSYEIKDTTDGCTAIVLATETGQIQSTWQTADGLKTVDVSPLLMAEYGWDIHRALDELYSSTTFAKLNDPECGLYYQGAVYIFQFLKSEIETGKVA